MASTCSVLVLLMTVQGWTRAVPVDTTDNVGVFYDQRQSGEYNIHVIVKDVGIVALLGDSLGDYEYDYSYDYEVPQKPLGSSTAEPASSVATQNSSSSSSSSSVATATTASSSTITTPGTLTESASNDSSSSVSPSDLTSPTSVESTTSTEDRTISTTSLSIIAECSISTKGDECNQQKQENGKRPGKGRRRCNVGYIRDNHGRCRRLRRPGQQNTGLELPFGLRLFPKLVAPLHTENS